MQETFRSPEQHLKSDKWVKDYLSHSIQFLKTIAHRDFSYSQYSLTGDLYSQHDNWGLGNLVFATKTLYMTNMLDSLSAKERMNLCSSIKSFSHNNGLIFDPIITKRPFHHLNFLQPKKRHHLVEIKRAETRQAFSALYLLGDKPNSPFNNIPKTRKKVEQFLESLDWENPWASGSHFSHLLFFLKMNSVFFKDNLPNEDLIQHAFSWIQKIQSSKDGAWYTGNKTSLQLKINGSMKVLTGLDVAGIHVIPNYKQLIDLALLSTQDAQACDNLNVVYVLYFCNRIDSTYRFDEIRSFMEQRLNIYQEYYHPNHHAFSFAKGKANDIYYGKRITGAKNEPDIHGTTLFTWGLSLIDHVLKKNWGFKIPLN